MAAVGDIIDRTDYNDYVSRINVIMGDGSGTTGYGQVIGSSHVPGLNDITAAQWQTLLLDINKAYRHQFGTDSGINTFNAGNIIGADASNTTTGTTITRNDDDTFTIGNPDNTKGVNDFGTALTALEVDPLTVDAGELTAETKLPFASGGLEYTASWGGGGDTGIYCEVDVNFSGGYYTANDDGSPNLVSRGDHRRYFFNAGGQIQIKSDLANPSTSQKDVDWNTLIGNTGTISMGSTTTTSTIGGTPVSIGFNDLTTTYQIIFSKNGSQAQYAENYYRIRAKLISDATAGTSGVRFEILFQDADTGDQRPGTDTGGGGAEGVPPTITPAGPGVDESVTGDVRVTISQLRPTGSNVNVPTGAFSVFRNLGP